MKICSICKLEKDYKDYYYRKDNNSYRNECKTCKSIIDKQYREKNKDKIKTKVKNKYYKNKEQNLEKAKRFYQDNKEYIKDRTKKYYYKNKSKIQVKRKEYQKNRLKHDSIFKLQRNLRNRLWYALNNKYWDKNTHFSEYIGLSDYNELKVFLEKQFKNNMSWDNYGKVWDIDHIIPLSNAKTEKELYKLCHYTNLQPSLIKINRIEKKNTFDFNKELKVMLIDYNIGQNFLIEHHYLHKKAPSEYTFGLFQNNGILVGVCTFHTPFSPGLKRMICGDEYKNNVIELNRLAVLDVLPKNTESWFISRCLNSDEIKKDIIVSFADTDQKHVGTIYQACNFIYTGLTASKKEFNIKNKTHAATLGFKYSVKKLKELYKDEFSYVTRSRKHRYVYFLNKNLKKHLKLNILPYPK